MALIGQIAIAMSVQTKQLKAGLSKGQAMIHSFEASVVSSGGALKALFAGAAAYGAARGLGKLISAGSDLNETISKTQAVFGDSAQSVIGAAQQMADAFGTSKNEFLAGASVLGGIFKGAGFGTKEAAAMAVQFSKLAVDVSSFANIGVQEALDKLRAGLTGESEPLKSLGILMNEDRVKAQAYAMGLAKVGTQLTEQQKVQARAALIMGSLADAQGDAARTANGVANASRGISGAMENLAATIGTALQPVAQAVLGDMGVAIQALSLAWNESGLAAMGAGLITVDSADGQSKSIGYVQMAVMKIADGWTYVKLAFLSVGSIIIKGLTFIIDLVGFFARGLDLVLKSLGQAESGAGKFFTDLAKGMEGTSEQMWTSFEGGLKAHFEGPAASKAVAGLFEKARAQIASNRKALAAEPRQNIPLAMGAPAKAHELKFATAMSAGSQDAVNTILRSRYGAQAGNNKPAEQTAQNTRKIVEKFDTLPEQIGAAVSRAFSGGNPLSVFGFGNF